MLAARKRMSDLTAEVDRLRTDKYALEQECEVEMSEMRRECDAKLRTEREDHERELNRALNDIEQNRLHTPKSATPSDDNTSWVEQEVEQVEDRQVLLLRIDRLDQEKAALETDLAIARETITESKRREKQFSPNDLFEEFCEQDGSTESKRRSEKQFSPNDLFEEFCKPDGSRSSIDIGVSRRISTEVHVSRRESDINLDVRRVRSLMMDKELLATMVARLNAEKDQLMAHLMKRSSHNVFEADMRHFDLSENDTAQGGSHREGVVEGSMLTKDAEKIRALEDEKEMLAGMLEKINRDYERLATDFLSPVMHLGRQEDAGEQIGDVQDLPPGDAESEYRYVNRASLLDEITALRRENVENCRKINDLDLAMESMTLNSNVSRDSVTVGTLGVDRKIELKLMEVRDEASENEMKNVGNGIQESTYLEIKMEDYQVNMGVDTVQAETEALLKVGLGDVIMLEEVREKVTKLASSADTVKHTSVVDLRSSKDELLKEIERLRQVISCPINRQGEISVEQPVTTLDCNLVTDIVIAESAKQVQLTELHVEKITEQSMETVTESLREVNERLDCMIREKELIARELNSEPIEGILTSNVYENIEDIISAIRLLKKNRSSLNADSLCVGSESQTNKSTSGDNLVEGWMQDRDKLEKEMDNLRAQLQELQPLKEHEVVDSDQTIGSLIDRINGLVEEKNRFEEEQRCAKEERDGLIKENVDIKEFVEKLEQDNVQLREEKCRLENDNTGLREESTSLFLLSLNRKHPSLVNHDTQTDEPIKEHETSVLSSNEYGSVGVDRGVCEVKTVSAIELPILKDDVVLGSVVMPDNILCLQPADGEQHCEDITIDDEATYSVAHVTNTYSMANTAELSAQISTEPSVFKEPKREESLPNVSMLNDPEIMYGIPGSNELDTEDEARLCKLRYASVVMEIAAKFNAVAVTKKDVGQHFDAVDSEDYDINGCVENSKIEMINLSEIQEVLSVPSLEKLCDDRERTVDDYEKRLDELTECVKDLEKQNNLLLNNARVDASLHASENLQHLQSGDDRNEYDTMVKDLRDQISELVDSNERLTNCVNIIDKEKEAIRVKLEHRILTEKQAVEDCSSSNVELEKNRSKEAELDTLFESKWMAIEEEKLSLLQKLSVAESETEQMESERDVIRKQFNDEVEAKISAVETELELALNKINEVCEQSVEIKREKDVIFQELADIKQRLNVNEVEMQHADAMTHAEVDDSKVKFSMTLEQLDRVLIERNQLRAEMNENIPKIHALELAAIEASQSNKDEVEKLADISHSLCTLQVERDSIAKQLLDKAEESETREVEWKKLVERFESLEKQHAALQGIVESVSAQRDSSVELYHRSVKDEEEHRAHTDEMYAAQLIKDQTLVLLENNIKELSEALEDLQKTKTASTEQVEKSANDIVRLEAEVFRLVAANAEKDESLTLLENKNHELVEALEITRSENVSFDAQLGKSLKDYVMYQAQIDQLSSKLVEKKKTLDELELKNTELIDSLNSICHENDLTKGLVGKGADDLDELRAEMNKMLIRVAEKGQSLEELENKNTDLNKCIEDLRIELASSANRMTPDLQIQFDQMPVEETEKDKTVTKLEHEVRELAVCLENLQRQRESSEEHLVMSIEDSAAKHAQVQQMSVKEKENEAALEMNRLQMKNLDADFKAELDRMLVEKIEADNTVEKLRNEIRELSVTLELVQNQNETIQEKMSVEQEDNERALEEVKRVNVEFQTQVDQLSIEKSENDKTVNKFEIERENNERALEEMKRVSDKFRTQVDKMMIEKLETDKTVEKLETEIKELVTSLQNMQLQSDASNVQLSRSMEDTAEIYAQLDQKENEHSSEINRINAELMSQVDRMSAEKMDREITVKRLQNEIAELVISLESMQRQNDSLREQLVKSVEEATEISAQMEGILVVQKKNERILEVEQNGNFQMRELLQISETTRESLVEQVAQKNRELMNMEDVAKKQITETEELENRQKDLTASLDEVRIERDTLNEGIRTVLDDQIKKDQSLELLENENKILTESMKNLQLEQALAVEHLQRDIQHSELLRGHFKQISACLIEKSKTEVMEHSNKEFSSVVGYVEHDVKQTSGDDVVELADLLTSVLNLRDERDLLTKQLSDQVDEMIKLKAASQNHEECTQALKDRNGDLERAVEGFNIERNATVEELRRNVENNDLLKAELGRITADAPREVENDRAIETFENVKRALSENLKRVQTECDSLIERLRMKDVELQEKIDLSQNETVKDYEKSLCDRTVLFEELKRERDLLVLQLHQVRGTKDVHVDTDVDKCSDVDSLSTETFSTELTSEVVSLVGEMPKHTRISIECSPGMGMEECKDLEQMNDLNEFKALMDNFEEMKRERDEARRLLDEQTSKQTKDKSEFERLEFHESSAQANGEPVSYAEVDSRLEQNLLVKSSEKSFDETNREMLDMRTKLDTMFADLERKQQEIKILEVSLNEIGIKLEAADKLSKSAEVSLVRERKKSEGLKLRIEMLKAEKKKISNESKESTTDTDELVTVRRQLEESRSEYTETCRNHEELVSVLNSGLSSYKTLVEGLETSNMNLSEEILKLNTELQDRIKDVETYELELSNLRRLVEGSSIGRSQDIPAVSTVVERESTTEEYDHVKVLEERLRSLSSLVEDLEKDSREYSVLQMENSGLIYRIGQLELDMARGEVTTNSIRQEYEGELIVNYGYYLNRHF